MKIRIKENQQEAIQGITQEYPYAYHHVNIKKTKVPWHWHEELELNYVEAGCVKVFTSGKSYIFQKGQAYFINSNVLCSMEDGGGDQACVLESHLFHSTLLAGHFKSIYETKYLAPILQNRHLEILGIAGEIKRQRELLAILIKLGRMQAMENVEFQTRNLLSEIWLLLMEEARDMFQGSKRGQYSENQTRIMDMLSYIHENYDHKILLEEIAEAASVSSRECIRCFQECIHKTPFDYVQDYRIRQAEKLLTETDLSVTEIAYATGFSGSAYFGKVFKNLTGKTPGNYRKGKDK